MGPVQTASVSSPSLASGTQSHTYHLATLAREKRGPQARAVCGLPLTLTRFNLFNPLLSILWVLQYETSRDINCFYCERGSKNPNPHSLRTLTLTRFNHQCPKFGANVRIACHPPTIKKKTLFFPLGLRINQCDIFFLRTYTFKINCHVERYTHYHFLRL